MNQPVMRAIDLLLSIVGLVLLWPVILLVYLLGLFDTGSPVFVQERVGRYQKPFRLIKFRTMNIRTESVATHMVQSSSVTKLGRVLRKTKLDELPQLINVVKGDMSLVGPRPCLYSQHELIAERENLGIFDVLPGITGLAQVNAIDMSTPSILAKWDRKMIDTFSVPTYFTLIVQTVTGKGAGDRVRNVD